MRCPYNKYCRINTVVQSPAFHYRLSLFSLLPTLSLLHKHSKLQTRLLHNYLSI